MNCAAFRETKIVPNSYLTNINKHLAMGSKKNNTKLSDLKLGQNLQNLQVSDLSKFQGGKKNNTNSSTNTRWNGCGDFVPL